MPEIDIESLSPDEVEAKLDSIKAKLSGEEEPKSEETQKTTEEPSKEEDKTFEEPEEEEDDYDTTMKNALKASEAEKKEIKEAGEEEEIEEKVVEKKVEEPAKGTEETKLTPEQAKEVKIELLKIAGEDKILKIKDKEVPISELTPEEVTFYLQRGIRADDVFQESARIRKEVDSEKSILSERAEVLGRTVRKGGEEQPSGLAFLKETTIPKELEPDDLDSEKEKVLKETCKTLITEVNQLKVRGVEQVIRQGEQEFTGEIKAHKSDFPLASTEEVIAVRSANSKIPIKEIMQVSDSHYGSVDFVKEVFKHRPDIKRHFTDEIVSDYKHKISKRRGIPEKQSGTVKVQPVASDTKLKLGGKKIEDYDFNDAEALAKKAYAKLKSDAEE
jgi:hypothetical protein